MRFAWSHKISFESPLTPDQVRERLKERFDTDTERGLGFWNLEPIPDVLPIWLSDEGFRTEYPRKGYRRSRSKAEAHGALHPVSSGTRIDLDLRMPEADQGATVFVVGLLVMMSLFALLLAGMKAIAGAALPLGFALLVWCMITAGYTRNARKIVRALEGSLDAPHGRFVERSATKA